MRAHRTRRLSNECSQYERRRQSISIQQKEVAENKKNSVQAKVMAYSYIYGEDTIDESKFSEARQNRDRSHIDERLAHQTQEKTQSGFDEWL